jgi:cytoskeletal protein CcmA (bactofilin family)
MKKKGTTAYESPDRLNVIVEGSKVMGDMITQSNLRIDGEVIGNVSTAAKVVIGPSGIIKGDLNCGEADIEGNITGNMKVDGLLTLRSTANVNGEMTTAKLQVEEGAQFSGNCSMSNQSSASTSVPKPQVKEEENDLVY